MTTIESSYAISGVIGARVIVLVLVMFALLAPSLPLRSQPADTVHPLQRVYAIGADEFLLAGAFHSWPNYHPDRPNNQWGPIDSLWAFAHAMGVDVIKAQLFGGIADIDALAESPLRRPTDRMYVSYDPIDHAGWGREVQFYLFDSVQSPYYQCRFLYRSGGDTTVVNRAMRDAAGRPMRETVYDSTTTRPGEMIASEMAFGWTPAQRYRYSYYGWRRERNERGESVRRDLFHNTIDYYSPYSFTKPFLSSRVDTTFDPSTRLHDSVQNAFTIFWDMRSQVGPTTHYVAVTGHLFEGGMAAAEDSLLTIEVWHQIPYGSTYRREDGSVARADTNFERLCARAQVRKRDLMPMPRTGYEAYREASFPVRFTSCPECPGGPLDPGTSARGFDVRLYWTGAERVAVRSVALRDSIGELVLGTTRHSTLYRQRILAGATRVLRGKNARGPLRSAIMRLYSGDEPAYSEYAAYALIDTMIRNRFNRGRAPGDSVMLINVVGSTARNFNHFNRPDPFYFQTYQLVLPHDTSREFGGQPAGPNYWFDVPHHTLPSIREHNGGRYHIPLLELDNAGVEKYTTTLQHAYIGGYTSGFMPWPYKTVMTYGMGEAAHVAREKGRRWNLELGLHSAAYVRTKYYPGDTTFLFPTLHVTLPRYVHDTLIAHIPEPAEIRTMANLAMAYGAKGIWYYWFGSTPNFLQPQRIGDSIFYVGGTDGIGIAGLRLRDTVIDYGYPFNFTSVDEKYRFALDSFYIGWNARTRAVKNLNAWLRRIGPALVRLRWRDAYSVHFGRLRPYVWEKRHPIRPLPENEIVNRVTTRSPRSGMIDSAWSTFVELGFFETNSGMTAGRRDPAKDTNHIFVVNRRTFERPPEISGTARAALMDSLSETRTIVLQLNLPDLPDYDRVRVREIAPDMTPLPLSATPRAPLDVIVPARGIVELTLGPARAALLEITYVRRGE